jgi:transposase
VNIRGVLHYLRAGISERRTARECKLNRRTVQKIKAWAKQEGLLVGELPSMSELEVRIAHLYKAVAVPQNQSRVATYRELVVQLRQEGQEAAAIWERLKERGFSGSYTAVWRYIKKLEPANREVTVRIECEPGEEGQVDFGEAGPMLDAETGQMRKSYVFVMTLSWSRHQYVEFVWDQKVETWLRLHRNALRYFGGVPMRLVIDNLKAGITKACWDDPEVQHAYAECAEHYGFLIAPCRPYTPQHKGKVESGVHYVKRNFLGGRTATALTQANQDVRHWSETTAGLRRHGTTREQPLIRFAQTEQAHLRPLPAAPYDLAIWKVAKLHRDCYVVFDNAYYSAPFRLVGQPLRIRGGTQFVQIYTLDYQLVATHDRAEKPGQRQTHLAHLPPEKAVGVQLNRHDCEVAARDIGVATAQVVETLLTDPVLDRLRTVQRLLQLRDRFGDCRLEVACARALRFADPSYRTVKHILETGQDREPVTPEPVQAAARTFVRSAADLVGHLFAQALGGGTAWN